eukprot:CAMPEP_0184255628 /NCGR_PEP_ID=MMETSP0977-20130417/8190_1 /TAXON_ID=483370 /ORGANISM="non described non described, Strain CCMP2097" /LENGTH=481 /DNA_ID=CAMNT_0026561201 /DNA_START=109 /DNA_END=1549 /DNA_ORIENTATION=+
MKRAGTPPAQPLAKPAWSDVAKCDKVKKPEWDERTGKLDSSFTYTVEGFKAKDPRFSEESVTVTITVLSDGRLRCDEVGCESPDFGKSSNTRGEYNVHKHVVAYHAPLQVSITADPDGVLKRVKQQSIGTFFKVTDQAGVDAQRAKAHDGRMRSFLARSPEPRASAPASAPAHGSVDTASAPTPAHGPFDAASAPARAPAHGPFDAEVRPVLDEPFVDEALVPAPAPAQRPPTRLALPDWLAVAVADAQAGRSVNELVSCSGIPLNLPEHGVNNFPFGIGSAVPALHGKLYFDSKAGVMRSMNCVEFCFVEDVNDDARGFTCDSCANLTRDQNVLRLVDRAWDRELAATTCRMGYLTFTQMREKAALQRSKLLRFSFAMLGRDRRLVSLMGQRDLLKQLITLLATHKIARVSTLLARQLKRQASVAATIDLVKAAIDGLFSPKKYDDEDLDQAILTMRIGGAAPLVGSADDIVADSARKQT